MKLISQNRNMYALPHLFLNNAIYISFFLRPSFSSLCPWSKILPELRCSRTVFVLLNGGNHSELRDPAWLSEYTHWATSWTIAKPGLRRAQTFSFTTVSKHWGPHSVQVGSGGSLPGGRHEA